MEEKERYYIEDDTIIDEEKRISGEQDITICDIDDPDILVDLLNQQDKRIKESEKENQKANIKNYLTDYYLVEKENQQLKQSQNQLAIKELEKVKQLLDECKWFQGEFENDYAVDWSDIIEIFDNQIKELKGEK